MTPVFRGIKIFELQDSLLICQHDLHESKLSAKQLSKTFALELSTLNHQEIDQTRIFREFYSMQAYVEY